MIVNLSIQSFVKNVVSVAIAGAVILGAGVYGIIWADQRLKNRPKTVAPIISKPQIDYEEESYHSSIIDDDEEEELDNSFTSNSSTSN